MSDDTPTNCQFCGASVEILKDGRKCHAADGTWVSFKCLSSWHHGYCDQRKFQSRSCEDRERNKLLERITRLEIALFRISNQDYRGNRSTESQIAFDALKEAKS